MRRRSVISVIAALLVFLGAAPATAATPTAGPHRYTGTVHGVPFLVEVPAAWNGTLLLFNHEHEESAPPLADSDATHPQVGQWLLAHGYALAGSVYANNTWTSPDMVQDQLSLLDWVSTHVGRPKHTVTWGISIGAQVTSVLTERHRERFDGALPMCGEMAGPESWYNGLLDIGYATRTLLGPQSLELSHISDPVANQKVAVAALTAAMQTPAGRARLALVNSFDDVPGWIDSLAPAPTNPDELAQDQAIFDIYQLSDYVFGSQRDLLEQQLGGNPAFNVGIDYRRQLQKSSQSHLVRTLYARAGLDLNADLHRLNAAPRIAPDPAATARLVSAGSVLGTVPVPTLTLHGTSDGTAPVETERRYADAAAAFGHAANLRQLYIRRANHCLFTAAEELTALRTLLSRVQSGSWPATDAQAMNTEADTYDDRYRVMTSYYSGPPVPVPAAFVGYRPSRWLR